MTAYAPISAQKYPSLSTINGGTPYTRKDFTIEIKKDTDLVAYALSQFAQYAYPTITYDVTASSSLLNSSYGLGIGDTIKVQDDNFAGGLILQARVSEIELSDTNPLNSKLTLSNYVKLQSQISDGSLSQLQALVDANTPYKAELTTDNGVQFKNNATPTSTTLGAHIFKGSSTTETIADSYEWFKDGVSIATTQTLTVNATDVTSTAVYSYQATIAGKVVASKSVTITNVNDGTSPINLVIDSSNGYQFKNNIINTTFTAILYQNNKEIDSDGTKFAYIWSKTNSDGTVDTAWNLAHQTSQKSITITNSDVWQRATFDCTAEPLN
ncbi:phage tail protein [Lactococcus fujiensis]|nr:phage tail protein [Lactococcus fujiensis]